MADTERDDESGKIERKARHQLDITNGWMRLLANYGLASFLLVLLLWYVVLPLKDGHLEFLKEQTAAFKQSVKIQEQQEELLRDNVRVQGEMLAEQQAQRATLERISGTLLRTERVISDPDTH